MTTLLTVRGLSKRYRATASLGARWRGQVGSVSVVQDVDFDVHSGQVLGLVGESGSGKSTTAMTVMRLQPASAGSIAFEGQDVTDCTGNALRAFRRRAQMVFQDPYQSINPRFTVLQTVAEPLVIHRLAHGDALRARAIQALTQAGLSHCADLLDRLPTGLSGGQRQRVSIARAMILEPRLLVADEPVSMLDVSVRAGVLTLLRRLAREQGLGVLYISHDLATVRYLCDRIAVMYKGRIVETGPTEAVLSHPKHPYTKALVAAVPRIRRAGEKARVRVTLAQTDASSESGSAGCDFQPRCTEAVGICAKLRPLLRVIVEGEAVACHIA